MDRDSTINAFTRKAMYYRLRAGSIYGQWVVDEIRSTTERQWEHDTPLLDRYDALKRQYPRVEMKRIWGKTR